MKNNIIGKTLICLTTCLALCSCSNDSVLDIEKLNGVNETVAKEYFGENMAEKQKTIAHSVRPINRVYAPDNEVFESPTSGNYDVRQDDNGNFGIYSVLDSKYVISPCYSLQNYHLRSYIPLNDSSIEFFEITNKETNKSVIYDNAGNLLDIYDGALNHIDIDTIEGITYFKLKKGYLHYDENKDPKFSDELFYESNSNNGLTDYSKYLTYGQLFKKSDTLYIYSDASGIYSFNIPSESKIIYFNNNLVFQYTYTVAKESEEFDFYTVGSYGNDVKNCVDTFVINFTEKTTTKIDTNYIITENSSANQKVFTNNRAIVSLSRINNLHILENPSLYLVEGNFDVIYNYKINYALDLISTVKGFYSPTMKVLLDKQFNIVTTLESFYDVKYYPNADVFVAKYNHKCGMFKSNGDILLNFEYDDIEMTDAGKYFICKLNNVCKVGKINTYGTISEDLIYCESYAPIDTTNGIYRLYNHSINQIKYFSLVSGEFQSNGEDYTFTYEKRLCANDLYVEHRNLNAIEILQSAPIVTVSTPADI